MATKNNTMSNDPIIQRMAEKYNIPVEEVAQAFRNLLYGDGVAYHRLITQRIHIGA